ncbi:GtrA-like protein [compost metagenome]
MRFLNKEFIKFVISGVLNTVATYLIYLMLLVFLEYSLAYTVSYLSGIFISYYLNTLFVFKEKISFKTFLKYPIVYVVQYTINLIMIFVLVEHLGLSEQLVPLIVVIITIPITFLLSKLIIRGNK